MNGVWSRSGVELHNFVVVDPAVAGGFGGARKVFEGDAGAIAAVDGGAAPADRTFGPCARRGLETGAVEHDVLAGVELLGEQDADAGLGTIADIGQDLNPGSVSAFDPEGKRSRSSYALPCLGTPFIRHTVLIGDREFLFTGILAGMK